MARMCRRELMGVVLLDDIRNIMFRPELYRRMRVSTFMAAPAARIGSYDRSEPARYRLLSMAATHTAPQKYRGQSSQ